MLKEVCIWLRSSLLSTLVESKRDASLGNLGSENNDIFKSK